MKTNTFKTGFAMLAAATLMLSSCQDEFFEGIDGQGELTVNSINLQPIDGITNMINATVLLSQGDEQEVRIEAQQNIIDNIRLDVINGNWKISYYHWVRYAKPVTIRITVPSLRAAAISGSGSISGLTPFTNLEKLSLVISGSGDMDLDTDSKNLDVTISGSGDFLLKGTTKTLDVLVSGSGNVDAYDLSSLVSDITISGSGSVYTAPVQVLDVLISGSGSVFYDGSPEVNANITGSGRVRHN